MSQKNNRRHRVLIDMPVQLGVALRLAVLWAATAVVTALVAVLLGFFADPGAGLLTHLSSPSNWAPSCIAFAVTLPIAVIDLIKFSHRFAGPVYRLRSELRSLAEGEARPPLTFRKGDYWTEMADDFNAVAELLRQSRNEAAPEPEVLVAAGEEQ